MAVEGRAKVVDDFGGAGPDGDDRARRAAVHPAGGRPDARRTTAPISYGGDEAVGRRVVEHLNYVI